MKWSLENPKDLWMLISHPHQCPKEPPTEPPKLSLRKINRTPSMIKRTTKELLDPPVGLLRDHNHLKGPQWFSKSSQPQPWGSLEHLKWPQELPKAAVLNLRVQNPPRDHKMIYRVKLFHCFRPQKTRDPEEPILTDIYNVGPQFYSVPHSFTEHFRKQNCGRHLKV